MKTQNIIIIVASVLVIAGCSHRERQAKYDRPTSAPAYGSSDSSGSSVASAESSATGAAASPSSEGKNPSDARTITSGNAQSQESLIYSNSTSQAQGAATSPSGTSSESVKGQGNDVEQKQEGVSPDQSSSPTADQSTTPPSGDSFNVNVQGSTSADQPVAQRIIEKIRIEPSLAGVMPLVRITVEDGKATLQGAVKTEEQKQQMEKTVQDVSGVTSVDNQLKVSATQNDSTNP